MATATLEPKIQIETITMELIPAVKEDITELDYWQDLGQNNYKKVMKMKYGIPFWLKSEVTGKIEPMPYRLTELTNEEAFKEWFKRGMVYINKNPFKNE